MSGTRGLQQRPIEGLLPGGHRRPRMEMYGAGDMAELVVMIGILYVDGQFRAGDERLACASRDVDLCVECR